MGNDAQRIRGLIMPADSVIPIGKLKKHLLFFDEVVLPDPSDRSLVADSEISDTYPDGTKIYQAARAPFTREEDYEAKFTELIAGTDQLQRRGILKMLHPNDWRTIDPWLRVHLYEAAIADERIVKSAIPDISENKPLKIPDGIISGLDIVKSGWKRIPQIRTDKPYKIQGVDDYWNTLAHLRIGRAIKYIRVAQIKNAAPAAFDDSTSDILLSLGQLSFQELPQPDILASLTISMDVIDAQALEKALEGLPWEDIIQIRREILPHVANYRAEIVNKSRRIYNAHATDFSRYREIVEADRSSIDDAKEKLQQAWQGLKIVGSLKCLSTSAVTGAASLLIPSDWTGLLATILTGIAIGGGAVANEIKTVLQARESVMKQPLFVLNKHLMRIK
ncbi:MAG: hypothetical protein WC853_12360 [Thermodesulfovibrionales bacterium]